MVLDDGFRAAMITARWHSDYLSANDFPKSMTGTMEVAWI